MVYGATQNGGANAEFICVSEKNLGLKPTCISHQEAASLPASTCTLITALKYSNEIQLGQNVILNGASGGVGSYAIQIAKLYTDNITAGYSSKKFEMALKLGATKVIDYKKTEFWTNGEVYGVIFDKVCRK